jgi:biopolymer transport protein ExbB/TolQ
MPTELLQTEHFWLLMLVLGFWLLLSILSIVLPPIFVPKAMSLVMKTAISDFEQTQRQRFLDLNDKFTEMRNEKALDHSDLRRIVMAEAHQGARIEEAVKRLDDRVAALEKKVLRSDPAQG